MEWRRAGDLSPDPGPRLVKDGVGRHDVVQVQALCAMCPYRCKYLLLENVDPIPAFVHHERGKALLCKHRFKILYAKKF